MGRGTGYGGVNSTTPLLVEVLAHYQTMMRSTYLQQQKLGFIVIYRCRGRFFLTSLYMFMLSIGLVSLKKSVPNLPQCVDGRGGIDFHGRRKYSRPHPSPSSTKARGVFASSNCATRRISCKTRNEGKNASGKIVDALPKPDRSMPHSSTWRRTDMLVEQTCPNTTDLRKKQDSAILLARTPRAHVQRT